MPRPSPEREAAAAAEATDMEVSLSPEPDATGRNGDDDDAMTSVASSEPDEFGMDDLVQIEGDDRHMLNGRQGVIMSYDNLGGAKHGIPDDWIFRLQLNAHPPGPTGLTTVYRTPVSGKNLKLIRKLEDKPWAELMSTPGSSGPAAAATSKSSQLYALAQKSMEGKPPGTMTPEYEAYLRETETPEAEATAAALVTAMSEPAERTSSPSGSHDDGSRTNSLREGRCRLTPGPNAPNISKVFAEQRDAQRNACGEAHREEQIPDGAVPAQRGKDPATWNQATVAQKGVQVPLQSPRGSKVSFNPGNLESAPPPPPVVAGTEGQVQPPPQPPRCPQADQAEGFDTDGGSLYRTGV